MRSLINGCRKSEWAPCLILSSKQRYLSQGVLPLPNHPYWLWLETDLPNLLACSRQTQNYPLLARTLALSLIYSPYFPFPISVLWWNEATDGQMGRWGSTVFPAPKANWERLGKDSVGLNSPDMMGKSMRASSAFAYTGRSAANALSAGSHDEFCFNSDPMVCQPRLGLIELSCSGGNRRADAPLGIRGFLNMGRNLP